MVGETTILEILDPLFGFAAIDVPIVEILRGIRSAS